MPTTDSTLVPGPEQVNELYWGSDRTVDEILNDLRIGRSTLYSSIQPAPAGSTCPNCGSEMVYTNRTSREAGVPVCLSCASASRGFESGSERASQQFEGPMREPESPWSRWREDFAAVTPERAAMVGGAAALGVVFGAAAARMIQEMR